jgi:GNAT superfamily N-acetyltransferase
MPNVALTVKAPCDCTGTELAAFCRLVRQGGEVDSGGLEARVRTAASLSFVHVDGSLAGVAALKRPVSTYRDGVFLNAGATRSAVPFAFELGWVFVPSEHRNRGYSKVVANGALVQSGGVPTFATSREDNNAMARTLRHLGFDRYGKSWKSSRGEFNLVLYVQPQGARALIADDSSMEAIPPFLDAKGRLITFVLEDDHSAVRALAADRRIGHLEFDEFRGEGINILSHADLKAEFQKAGIGTRMMELAVEHFEPFLVPGKTWNEPREDGLHTSIEGRALINSCMRKGILTEQAYADYDEIQQLRSEEE